MMEKPIFLDQDDDIAVTTKLNDGNTVAYLHLMIT